MIGVLVTAVVVALSFSQPGSAVDLEREARVIDEMLIAPCCFTQQVSEHRSAAADDVRRDVRARLAAGQTRQQILDAYVGRYGKRILAEPPAAGFDFTLYVVPFLMLVASGSVVVVLLRRFTTHHPISASGNGNATSLITSPDDEAKLDDELRDLD